MRSIPDDVRYRIFNYLWNVRRVGSRNLGISSALANMVKNRKRRVTDSLLKCMLELLTPEEYAELVEEVTAVRVDSNTFVKILVSAVADPALKPILVEFVKNRLAAEMLAETTRYTVTKQDLQEFRSVLEKKVLGEIIAVLTGQTDLAKVEMVIRHYFGGSIEKMREFYDENAPQILEEI
ncbi:MAG: hypothetical protein J7J20_02775 [Desulfurococcales archaeon]|nr:hypothetical protein [Desulfurococcales archaeon]